MAAEKRNGSPSRGKNSDAPQPKRTKESNDEISEEKDLQSLADAENSPKISHANEGDLNEKQLPKVDPDVVISNFSAQSSTAAVARQYANEHTADKQVKAYAKLSGRDWTYYVQKLEVIIGRTATDSNAHVDIDLAPSKVVSRQHAIIRYNLMTRSWEVEILGRNGIRLDGLLLRDGYTSNLSSGNIIDIGGVQMMFVLPDAEPVIAPIYIQKTKDIMSRAISRNMKPKTPNSTTGGAGIVHPYPKGVTILSRNNMAFQDFMTQDLSSPEFKDVKPPYSYATMISQAILSTPEHMMTLADIYQWISGHYAFYKYSKPGWQNSIRHNLSLNKAFQKVARKDNEPGKGSKWHIVESYKPDLIKKAMQGRPPRDYSLARNPQPQGPGKLRGMYPGPNAAPIQPGYPPNDASGQPPNSNQQMADGQPGYPMNMGMQGQYPMQQYPYMPPYNMQYYPQNMGQMGQMIPMYPMNNSPEVSPGLPIQQKFPDSQNGEGGNSKPQEDGEKVEAGNSREKGNSNTGSQDGHIETASDSDNHHNSETEGRSHHKEQASQAENAQDSNSSTQSSSQANPKGSDFQTPAKANKPRELTETPLLNSAIKLPPFTPGGQIESSPALWKYMNLESTPNNQEPGVSDRTPIPGDLQQFNLPGVKTTENTQQEDEDNKDGIADKNDDAVQPSGANESDSNENRSKTSPTNNN